MLLKNSTVVHQSFLALDAGSRDTTARFIAKRCFDLVLAITLFIILSPVMLIIAILIKLDSPGPVLFTQERVGAKRRREGQQTIWTIEHFTMYKFRSMVQNADETVHQAHIKAFAHGSIAVTHGTTTSFKLTNDPRITPMGHILRKTSLDELPQLLNVIKGEMSLIGPRPVPTYEVAEYRDWYYERFSALPGITGLWQVKGRSQVSLDDMIGLDIEYTRQRSLRLDLKILLLTIPVVLLGKGAG